MATADMLLVSFRMNATDSRLIVSEGIRAQLDRTTTGSTAGQVHEIAEIVCVS